MRSNIFKVCILGSLLLLVACQRPPEFKTSYFGGGGYITGLVQDPHNPQIMFGRCDVGGVFRTTDGANTWEAVNNGMTFWAQHGCRSVCLDTVVPTTIYRCCGNMMNQQHFGYIFRSDDLGENWTLLTTELDYYGNGPVRNGGEMLAIDPHNHKHIVAGSFSKGLWHSFDQGQTWQYIALQGARIAAVRYTHEGELLVATTYDGTVDSLAKSMDVARNHPSQLYRFSSDLKESEVLYASADHGIYDILCPRKGIYLISTTQGLLRSADNGQTFVWDSVVPQDGLVLRLAQSVARPSYVYTARKFSEKDTLRLYESKDYGMHWHLYAAKIEDASFREYPNYGTPDYGWFGASIAAIIPDAKDTNTLHFSNYWGVNTTYDGGQSWTAHDFKGLNILCGESMLFDPNVKGRMYAAICDHGVFVSNDYGQNFQFLNPKVSSASTRCIAASHTNPDFLLWTEGNRRNWQGTPVKRTFDGGQTADTVLFNRANSYVQALQEDPLHPGRYYLMQEGVFDDPKENGGIYRTDDWGSTWYRVTNPFPDYIKDLPYRRKFIDEDYLPCVCYQTKNGSGTNQILALDHFCEDVVYVGEWTEGIWRTTDGGKTWKDISQSLPMREDSTIVLSQIFADPDHEGVVYAGFWKAGLWRSDDFGNTWTKVRQCNAISMDKHGQTILLASCGHGYAPAPTELLLSENNGRTWRNIYNPTLGALRFISVLLDTDRRTAYVLTTGNSIVYCNY